MMVAKKHFKKRPKIHLLGIFSVVSYSWDCTYYKNCSFLSSFVMMKATRTSSVVVMFDLLKELFARWRFILFTSVFIWAILHCVLVPVLHQASLKKRILRLNRWALFPICWETQASTDYEVCL